MMCSFSSACCLVAGPIQSRLLISSSMECSICVVMRRVFCFSSGLNARATNSCPQRLAELIVNQGDATLPARSKLRNPAQRLAKKVEVLVYELVREVRRGRVHRVPAQVGLNVVELERL